MASKGAKVELEPICRQAYIDGKSLTTIEEMYGVSRQTLSTWKAKTKKPNEDRDEWDKARARKVNFGIRMEALLERELTHAEERQAGAIDSALMDGLTKLGSLVVKFKTAENAGLFKAKVNAMAEDVVKVAKLGGMSETTAKEIRRRILGIV